MTRRPEPSDYYVKGQMMTLNVTAFTGLGPGSHDVNVTNCEVKIAKKTGSSYLLWEFTDGEGKTTSAASSVEMTPGNKTGRWFAALTGKPTVVGENRQIQEVIGAPATIFLEMNADGFPKVTGLTSRTQKAHPSRSMTPAQQAAQIHAVQEGDPTPEAPTDELPF